MKPQYDARIFGPNPTGWFTVWVHTLRAYGLWSTQEQAQVAVDQHNAHCTRYFMPQWRVMPAADCTPIPRTLVE